MIKKTTNSFDNLRIDETNIDGILEATLEQFLCI